MSKALVAVTLIVISLLVILFVSSIQVFQPPVISEYEIVTLEESRMVAEEHLSKENKFTDINGSNINMVNAINTGCDSCWVLQFEFDSDIGVAKADVHMQDGEVVF